MVNEAHREAKWNYVLEKLNGYPDQRIKQAVLKKLEENYACST